ncbi:MAG: hypothetical protein ACTHK0_17185 [Ginsengibacter sp.]
MNNYIPIGLSRFLFYLEKIKTILQKAESAENPALNAYTQDLRTPLFMLEALSRLYKKIHPHQKLKKLNKQFKELEDQLGAIDYYDSFAKEFALNDKIPSAIITYLKDKTAEKTEGLNTCFKKENWIGNNNNRISKITKTLQKIDWLNEKEDTAAILNIYQQAIEKLDKKYKIPNLRFTDVEKDVHELRRELRWLSIYPQALRGLIQLKSNPDTPDFLKKYLTPEILHSLFNIMPDGSNLQDHIFLNDNYYYALSWMIAELGKLKDNGLKIVLIEESISIVYKTNENVEQLAYGLCGENQMKIPQVLTHSEQLANTFFDENILENLIIKK